MDTSRDSAKEAIRTRVGVLDLISEYVTLKRAGKNYIGLCPFHSEKTPSFNVREEFQTWHCFGCGEHGDIFSFLMKIENLTFAEALERLAKRAGVELPAAHGIQTSRRDLLGKINSLAASYYSELLRSTPAAAEYLRDRGLSEQAIKQFHVGYASPGWDGLLKHLTGRGLKPEDGVEAGVLIKGERGSIYDRFRQRIVFPIFDIQERIIGFSGRALGEEQPKYLNSPETPLFSKTRALYALNHARKSIADKGFAVVVEGQMDVIACHQAGFTNCVATLGTALTSDHVKILGRYAGKVVLAYDSDSAGMKAALRGAAMFEQEESYIRIARLPAGDDPDSLLKKGNVAEFTGVLTNALSVVDYKLALLKDTHDLATPAGRTEFLKEAAKVLAEVPSGIEREKHIRGLAQYHPNFGTGTTRAEDHIRSEIERLSRRSRGKDQAGRSAGSRITTAVEAAEKSLLRMMIQGQEGMDTVAESVTADDFSGEVTRAAAELVLGMFAEKKGIYLAELLDHAEGPVGAFLSELAVGQEGPPVTEKALQDFVALVKNAKIKNLRTSDVLGPYLTRGVIDGSCEHTLEELNAFLKKKGKLPRTDGMGDSDG